MRSEPGRLEHKQGRVWVSFGERRIMLKNLILKLVSYLLSRKVGQKPDGQKIIVVGDVNITIVNNK